MGMWDGFVRARCPWGLAGAVVRRCWWAWDLPCAPQPQLVSSSKAGMSDDKRLQQAPQLGLASPPPPLPLS